MTKRVIYVTEAEAAGDFAALLARVRTGTEVVIEDGSIPVARVLPAAPKPRKISECIALLREDSAATIDPDFAKDVEAAVASHRESLNRPAWD